MRGRIKLIASGTPRPALRETPTDCWFRELPTKGHQFSFECAPRDDEVTTEYMATSRVESLDVFHVNGQIKFMFEDENSTYLLEIKEG